MRFAIVALPGLLSYLFLDSDTFRPLNHVQIYRLIVMHLGNSNIMQTYILTKLR